MPYGTRLGLDRLPKVTCANPRTAAADLVKTVTRHGVAQGGDFGVRIDQLGEQGRAVIAGGKHEKGLVKHLFGRQSQCLVPQRTDALH